MFQYLKLRYDEVGNAAGTPDFTPPMPTRLSWELNDDEVLNTIEEADKDAQVLLNVSLLDKYWYTVFYMTIYLNFRM